MNANPTRKVFNKALLSALIAGGVAAYSSASWAASESESDTATTQQQAQDSNGQEAGKQGPELHQMDQNNDRGLSWSEISAIYDDELDEIAWNREYVFETYDEDGDNVLSEDEYVNFLGNLVSRTVEQADPPSSSLDTTAGMDADENEPVGNVNSRARQMRVNEYSAARGEDSNAMEQATKDRPNERQTADYAPETDPSQEEAAVEDLAVDEIENREVVNADGKNLGQVESVVTAPDGSISGLVVGVGGFWQVGNKDVFVPVDQVKRSGENIVWETELDEDELDNMPQHSKERGTSYMAVD